MRYQGGADMVVEYCGGPINEGEKFWWKFANALHTPEIRLPGIQWKCEYPVLCERCAVKYFW